MGLDAKFWKDKSVLLTGHTGFKGVWTALMLSKLGAHVTGIALGPEWDPAFFSLLAPWSNLPSYILDIRDQKLLDKTVRAINPEIVIHMAAQAYVRESYRNPMATFATNVMGTLNLLETLRKLKTTKVALIVTSDKVYRGETEEGFLEQDCLGGDDPYSASKACVEIAVNSWQKSFFAVKKRPVIATARAGNVIGGGDFGSERLIPDAVLAYQEEKVLRVRYPDAIRPWQYVLDVITFYLLYIQKLYRRTKDVPLALNFGPRENEKLTVAQILEIFQPLLGDEVCWGLDNPRLPEKQQLHLNSTAAQEILKWHNQLSLQSALTETAKWYRAYLAGKNMRTVTNKQLESYLQNL